jgi:DNA adenine methylase
MNHIELLPKSVIPKPILKWVGGKTQIIDKLIIEFPVEINNYFEIFLGGGSVLITLLSYIKAGNIKVNGNIYAYDLNEPLIYMYKNIQTHPQELYDSIQVLILQMNQCRVIEGIVNRKPTSLEEALTSKESYYYWIRKRYNTLTSDEKKTIIGSAMFIYLNKTCFRGIFRVGPNGFNVPFGHNKNPEIINLEHLFKIHELIQCVLFEKSTFQKSITNASNNGDFVYLDPPYAAIETEKSFVGYTENGFGTNQHKELFDLCDTLKEKKVKMIMSNADVELVRKHFTTDKYILESIVCKRLINSKKPDAKASELIIRN